MADVDHIRNPFPLNPVTPGKPSDRRGKRRDGEKEPDEEGRDDEGHKDKPEDGHVDEYA